MNGDRFDALVHAGVTGLTRRRTVAGAVALALGAWGGAPIAAKARRCDGCRHDSDCRGRAKCRRHDGKQSCCKGYWWRGDCYDDKPAKRKGWRFFVSNGELYYCKADDGIQHSAKLICRGR